MDKIKDGLLRGEFIGLSVTANQIKGKIIDETKNLFLIDTKEGIRKMNKKNNTFKFICDNKSIQIDGKTLILRPEDRIKANW